MKKLPLLILFMTFSLFIKAQDKPSFNYYSLETLEAIGTTKAQQAQIVEIKKNTDILVRTIKKDQTLTEEVKKAKYEEIYTEGGVLYKKVLTEEQNEKLKLLYKKFQEKNS